MIGDQTETQCIASTPVCSGSEGPYSCQRTKRPAHPGNKSPERLALNSSIHVPLRETVCVSSSASDQARSLLNVGGGLLPDDEYHTRKVVLSQLEIELNDASIKFPTMELRRIQFNLRPVCEESRWLAHDPLHDIACGSDVANQR